MTLLKRSTQLTVVVATRHAQVIGALERSAAQLGTVGLERREALSREGAYRALHGAQLAIVDLEDLAPGPDASTVEALEAALSSTQIVAVDSTTFLRDPLHYLEAAVAGGGLGALLPPRCVAFTALAGGVGRTTLALATALTFHRATGLPAAVVELSPGPSALLARTATQGADLYQVLTQGEPYPTWSGVTLVPLSWETARLLAAERLREAWETVAARHIYTAFDAPAWHPLYAHVSAAVTFVLADQRPEAQAAALLLLARLREEGQTAALGLNRAGLGGRLALPEKPVFALRTVRDPLTLGRQALPAIYPGWRHDVYRRRGVAR